MIRSQYQPIHPIAGQGSCSILDPDVLTAKKVTGREKGASAYTAVGHVALLSIISEIPDAFKASEGSPQWEAVYKRMVTEFYRSGSTGQSGAFHEHFVDLYSAFHLGIRNLSVLDKEKKWPMEYQIGDNACGQYVEVLNNLLGSDGRKYKQKNGGN